MVKKKISIYDLPEAEKKIYTELLKSPGMLTENLIERTGYARNTVFRALKNLEKHGFVVRKKEGRKVLNYPELSGDLLPEPENLLFEWIKEECLIFEKTWSAILVLKDDNETMQKFLDDCSTLLSMITSLLWLYLFSSRRGFTALDFLDLVLSRVRHTIETVLETRPGLREKFLNHLNRKLEELKRSIKETGYRHRFHYWEILKSSELL